MKKIARLPLLALLLIVNLTSSLFALEAPNTAEPFKDGEVICFVGDSITRGGGYHAAVQLFYATRYPDRTIQYFNCGRSGCTASGTLQRLGWDVLNHKPTSATVMLGMNDMGGNFYAEGTTDAQATEKMKARVESVAANYEKLLAALEKANVKLTLIGPSMYDDTAKLEKAVDKRRNDALEMWTARVKAIAEKHHAGYADFHTPMTTIDHATQVTKPEFTLVGPDRVHPGPVGHFTMAYFLLKAQGHGGLVGKFKIDAAASSVLEQHNCTVIGLKSDATSASFSYTAKALPFPVSPEQKPALEFVQFMAELNQEVFTITNLAPGRYALKIDESVVGTYTHTEFAAGVNLASNDKTPQYQQAQRVAKANEDRHRIESSDLRGIAYVRFAALEPAKADPNDPDAVAKAFDAYKAKHTDPKDFGLGMIKLYPRWMANKEKTEQTLANDLLLMRKECVPVPHKIEISKVETQ